jgi:hypothetical protein
MERETLVQVIRRWRALADHAIGALSHYEAEIDQFADALRQHKEKRERLSSEGKTLIGSLGANGSVTEQPASLTQILNNGLPEAIDEAAVLRVRAESERLRERTAAIRVAIAKIRDAMDRFRIASSEYEVLLQKNLEWVRRATEPGLQLQEKLTDTHIIVQRMLYAIELGKIVNRREARLYIMRFVVRYPDASDAMIVAHLDDKGIRLPRADWEAAVGRKYGCALWKYSWEGDPIKGIAADKKIRHRTAQYLWRHKKMAHDLLALYKIKSTLQLRKLRLPEMATQRS